MNIPGYKTEEWLSSSPLHEWPYKQLEKKIYNIIPSHKTRHEYHQRRKITHYSTPWKRFS
ncbi:17536_t:CDS:2 [Entrophospora sp. SA101]|nr:17536_t:CDS:2 [Entrophospora sp. SA101]